MTPRQGRLFSGWRAILAGTLPVLGSIGRESQVLLSCVQTNAACGPRIGYLVMSNAG